MPNDPEPPHANEAAANPETPPAQTDLPPLMLPPPSGYSSGYDVIEAEATLRDEKGRDFRVNLLSDGYKFNPHEESEGQIPITHILVVCPEDDGYLIHDVIADVLEHNNADELAEAAGLGSADDDDDEE